MALTYFSNISKRIQLSDGTGYAYVYVAGSTSKPTFLLLHGFPSSSYDWRHQIDALAAKGFGVLVPDLLGYGDTDSPAEVEAYSSKRMSDHLVEILVMEGITKVIGVGHDWGSGLLSSFHTWHAEYLLALVFVSIGYIEPSDVVFDLDAWNEETKRMFGYPLFGYIKLFATEEAATLLDNHPDSITSLFYPAEPETWKTDLGPIGAAETWIKSNKTTSRPSWLSSAEITTHNDIIRKKGYHGPLNWYKSMIRGLDRIDDASLPTARQTKQVNLPTLLVLPNKDYCTLAEMQKHNTAKWVTRLRIEELDCAHWVQLELPERLNGLLEGFADEVKV